MDEPLWKKIITYGLEFIGLHYSSYRGIVVDNEDPLKVGRLRVLVPDLNTSSADDTWMWPKGNYAGNNYGAQVIPKKGDMIWVEYLKGDADFPIWSHGHFADGEVPEEFETIKHFGFKTPKGNVVLIDDNDDQESILVKRFSQLEWIRISEEEIEVEGQLIKLGKDSEEKALLGDTTKEKLENLLDNLDTFLDTFIQHTHPSNGAPAQNIAQATNIKTQVGELKNSLDEILSEKVKLE